ncbi:MAG: hypothetical protein ACP5NM_11105, partial [Thiomonas sp.]
MLHAVERKKTSLPQGRYGFVREASERRRTQEDEITSIVFGPLEFLDESDVARLWLYLIGETPQSIDAPRQAACLDRRRRAAKILC